jgi:hypothetical protein
MKKSPRSMTAALIAASLLAVSASARAEFFTGHELLTRLRSNDLNSQLLARGYILGVHDSQRTVTHCSPMELTAERLVNMAKTHLEGHTDLRNTTADVVLGRMMRAIWPCQERNAI